MKIKKKTFVIISFFTLLLIFVYSGYHAYLEFKIKSIKSGSTAKFKVISILGEPKESIKGPYIELRNQSFNFYKSSGHPNLGTFKSSCMKEVTREEYKGHTCFFVCPSAFEDKVTVYYDQNDFVCEIKRIGL